MKLLTTLKNHKLISLFVSISLIGAVATISITRLQKSRLNQATTNAISQESETSTSTLDATGATQINPADGSVTSQLQSPTPTTTPKPILMKGFGSVTIEGASSNINMTFPKEGGAISGTVSGFCHGSISGTFEKSSSKTSGTLKGTCMLIPATGTFDGSISIDTKTGSGSLNGSGGQHTKSGTWKITIE